MAIYPSQAAENKSQIKKFYLNSKKNSCCQNQGKPIVLG